MRFTNLLDRARPTPFARRTASRLLPARRMLDLQIARAFFFMDHDLHYLLEGCSSIGELGERMGYSASEARTYARAGMVFRLYEEAAPLFLRGRLTLEAAAVLQRVLRAPEFQREGDDWFGWAEKETARDLRLRVKKRLEECRVQAPVVEVTVHLSEKGRGDLDRCRELLSGKTHRAVSESEAVETVADDWLERNDPRRREPAARRVGDTRVNRSRHVPEEVKREVIERARARCEKPGCGATWGLQFAHIDGHAEGGGREADDLVYLCGNDHRMYDAGWLDILRLLDDGGLLFTWRWNPRPRPGEKPPPGARRRRTPPPHFREWRWKRLAESWDYRREIAARGVP
jgi:hypothetical protein